MRLAGLTSEFRGGQRNAVSGVIFVACHAPIPADLPAVGPVQNDETAELIRICNVRSVSCCQKLPDFFANVTKGKTAGLAECNK